MFCRCAAQSSEGASVLADAPLVMVATPPTYSSRQRLQPFIIRASGGFHGLVPESFLVCLQAGGKDPDGIPAAVAAAEEAFREALSQQ